MTHPNPHPPGEAISTAEAMREAAAKVADDFEARSLESKAKAERLDDRYMVDVCDRAASRSRNIANHIRALPVADPPAQGEVAGLIAENERLRERLLLRAPSDNSFLYGDRGGYLFNPDGPEAATTIARLSAAAENAIGTLNAVSLYFEEGSFGLVDIETAIERLEAALSTGERAG